MSLLSHPDRTLEEHLQGLDFISEKLLSYKHFNSSFVTKEELNAMRILLVYFHDLGKGTDFFQHKIIEVIRKEHPEAVRKYEDYLKHFEKEKANNANNELNKNHHLSRHAGIGAYYLLSNFTHDNVLIEYILLHIIKQHHGDLKDYEKGNFVLFEEDTDFYETQLKHLNIQAYNEILNSKGFNISTKQWKGIVSKFERGRAIGRNIRQLEEEKSLWYFLFQHYLYSFLLSADKGDVKIRREGREKSDFIVKQNELLPANLVNFYKEKEFGTGSKRPIDIDREEAYQDIAANIIKHKSEAFFSITLPTGMGKTFSAYNAAILLQNSLTETNYRIVYCLPFTSIIDQNEQVLRDILEASNLDDTLVAKHHYLAHLRQEYGENDELTYQEAEYLTEGWEQEVIVTTFVQLLESIFTNKNKRIRKFHNMTNAIILLDEVQNIPPKYYEVIEAVFAKMAEFFNTKFLFITATQPALINNHPIIELTETETQTDKTKKWFEKQKRIQLDKSLLKEGVKETEELIKIFAEDIKKEAKKSFLIICNTIRQSQEVFKALEKDFEGDTFYISSSVLPLFRKTIIENIQKNNKEKKRQLVVSTQVVEAGVDIDLDIVYRDFAVLDSINQSAGRCNRNGENGTGTVKLFHSGKAKWIYDKTLLNCTQNVLDEFPDIIPESSFYALSTSYFQKVKNAVQDNSVASNKIRVFLETLQLEKLNEEFELISQERRHYDVFIPFSPTARDLWQQFLDLQQIEDVFERKREIKKLRPDLLQYVTRFPNNKYDPPEDQKDKGIIYEENWDEYYDLKYGFKLDREEPTLAFF
jgi:CRISPR-associated endonuclease/helicase Cas3